jgi:uncharacterized protein YndB with AHSA1/START domain
MAKNDWSSFKQTMYYNVPVSKVYEIWTTRTGLESFFLSQAAFTKPDGTIRDPDSPIQKGDTYKWRWYGYDVEEYGEITEANGTDTLRFVFGEAGLVTISLREEQGGTFLTLLQEQIPNETEELKFNFRIGCATGWTFYRANLKSVLEGGLDIRNKNPDIKTPND